MNHFKRSDIALSLEFLCFLLGIYVLPIKRLTSQKEVKLTERMYLYSKGSAEHWHEECTQIYRSLIPGIFYPKDAIKICINREMDIY